MKSLLIIYTLFSFSNLHAEGQFITEEGVQIPRGYGNTSESYVGFDMLKLDQSWKFKKRNCYKSKLGKFALKISELKKLGFEYTDTWTYINNIPGKSNSLATFIVSFVKDTLDGEWEFMFNDLDEQDRSGPRIRPADFLVYKRIHFECELEHQVQIQDQGRTFGKDLPRESANPSTGTVTKEK